MTINSHGQRKRKEAGRNGATRQDSRSIESPE
jgi:hypothetical protein